MGIDRLRYFAAVVETKNLRKAADIVGITPGSISKAISVLEEELGLELLRPEGRGIEITQDGYRVYQSSATLLDEFRRFSENLTRSQPKELNTKLRIGTFEIFSSYFLSALLEAEFANSEALILELTPGNIEQAVAEGLVQYGLTYLPAPNRKLEFIEVGSFVMGIFGLKKWTGVPFENWPFAVPVTQLKINSLSHTSLDMWPQTKPRMVKYEFELLETALQTSRAGLSVLHCPEFIATLHNRHLTAERKLVRLVFPEKRHSEKKIKIFLVAKKGDPSIKLVEGKFARFLRSLNSV